MPKAKNLVIVESPAKAKTIARYLGGDYRVESSYGHLRDLPKNELGVDIENDFEPTYIVSPDKQKFANQLKAAAKDAEVWLASDEDREGEAIAWHVCHILGVEPAKTKRIVFHEITRPAIEAAIKSPRTVDEKLVDAQQARRVLDRLVGYELSPILWRKVRVGLSAGRVQSVAVRLLVEREREIKAFQPEVSYKVSAVFLAAGGELPAELDQKLADETAARQFIEQATAAEYKVGAVSRKAGSRNPGPPFTTSTLQQEASRRLGFSVRQTMVLAQRLYENGHITYMRTDSPAISPVAIKAAERFIVERFGRQYHQSRQFKAKTGSAQEAHEAIRPTNLGIESVGAESGQRKLYELIWRRALASQMAPAKTAKTIVEIPVAGSQRKFMATGEVLEFDGFIKVYGGGKDDSILPPVEAGDRLRLQRLSALETYSRPPARYSEASLVKKLEELGIGRPSTYAPTISTIQDRGYAEKSELAGEDRQLNELVWQNGRLDQIHQTAKAGADRNKLVPTHLAEIVTDFLVKYFEPVIDYGFTAMAEEELDDIAAGKQQWRAAIKTFYERFHPLVQASAAATREEVAQARRLGDDPKTKQPVSVRFARYGPVIQLGETPAKDDKTAPKPLFAPLPAGADMATITLEQALPMFDLPRVVGQTSDGQEITANVGRYGPYVKVGGKFYSIKDQDPLLITEAEARQVISAKQQVEAERQIADFGQLKILKGPYGPYVTDGKKNAKIPKTVDPANLDEAAAKDLLAKAPAKPKRRFKRRA